MDAEIRDPVLGREVDEEVGVTAECRAVGHGDDVMGFGTSGQGVGV
ncbi:hypothetical protein [Streptomyces sp. NPDC088789]